MEFYPPKYWGLDPMYHACVKLTVADVLNLTEHPTCKGMYSTLPYVSMYQHLPMAVTLAFKAD